MRSAWEAKRSNALANRLARRARHDPEGRLQAISLSAREVVVVVPPPASQARVLGASIRQGGTRIQAREPLQRGDQIHQLHPHGGRDRERRRARTSTKRDVQEAARAKSSQVPNRLGDVPPAAQQATVAFLHQRIETHVVIENPHHRAGPILGECVQVALQHGSGVGDGEHGPGHGTAIENPPVQSVVGVVFPVHEVDTQTVAAFVFD